MKAAVKGVLPTFANIPGGGPAGKYCSGCDAIRPLVRHGDSWMAAPPGTVKWCSKMLRLGTTIPADEPKPHTIGALKPMTQACKKFEDLSKRKTAP